MEIQDAPSPKLTVECFGLYGYGMSGATTAENHDVSN
jgi:hypothetical protein